MCHTPRPGTNARARPLAPFSLPGRLAGGLLLAALLAGTGPAAAQEADSAEAGSEGPERIGAFHHVRQGESLLLAVPDTASSLEAGARLFLRCRGGDRDVYVALAGGEGGLGNAREGAAGQFRIDRGPWTDLERWGANAAGTAAFMNPERIPTFVGRAEDGELAEIRIVNPAGVRRKFVFPTEGLGEALSRLPCMSS